MTENKTAWEVYKDLIGEHYATEEHFNDCYYGRYKDEVDWAYQWIEDMGILRDASDLLNNYFDYEKFARDAFINDMMGGYGDDGWFYVFHR